MGGVSAIIASRQLGLMVFSGSRRYARREVYPNYLLMAGNYGVIYGACAHHKVQ
jgi:hypothetical protein